MENLADIFTRIGHFGSDAGENDKGSTHSYIPTYDRLFAPYRKNGSILEIGLATGKSLDLWGQYFGPESTIVGVDISVVFDTSRFDKRFTVIEADATSTKLVSLLKSHGHAAFDIIIDDGSHMEQDQETTFRLLSPLMKSGGLYIIEDIISPDSAIPRLSALRQGCEVIDLRGVKGRFDDALIIHHF